MLMLNLDWGSIIDSAHIVVNGPDGVYELVKLDLKDESADEDTLQFDVTENFATVEADSTVNLVLFSPGAKETDSYKSATLTPGDYQLLFTYNSDMNAIDSLGLSINSYYPETTGNLSVENTSSGEYDLALNYWSYLTDSVDISFYWNDTASYNGYKLDSLAATTVNDTGFIDAAVHVLPEYADNGDEIYFYAIIDDGVNKPYYTDFTESVFHTNPVSGQVIMLEDGIKTGEAGITAYLDKSQNGSFDTDSTGGREYAVITDDEGYFSFNQSLSDSIQINIVIPYGYVLDESSPDQPPYIYQQSSQPAELTYIIRKENTVQRAKN